MQVSNFDLDNWTRDASITLPIITGINNTALLRALCGQESSYGLDGNPRHEGGWCPNVNKGVSRVAADRHREWGCLACCSYGPLQALYHSLADTGLVKDPTLLLNQQYAFDKSLGLLIAKIRKQQPLTVTAVADLWNSGSWQDDHIPTIYIASVLRHYAEEVKRLA